MTNLENLFGMAAFSLNAPEKTDFLNAELLNLTRHHYLNCNKYKRMLGPDAMGVGLLISY